MSGSDADGSGTRQPVPDGSATILLDAVANALPVMFNAKDLSSRYIFMNQYQADLYGVTPREAVGKTAADLLGPAYGSYTRAIDRQVTDSGEATRFFEEAYAGVDGMVRQWLTSKVPLKDGNGQVWGVATVAIDISERRRLEAELRAARDLAELASRAKTRFLANMSHEIRTPLNGLLGMIELLAQTELTPQQRQYVEVANRTGEILLGLIISLLDFSKIEAGRLELDSRPFDPRQILHDVFAPAAVAASARHLAMSCRCDEAMPASLIGDAERLRQVLTNLVDNALKFTRRGAIDVAARVDEDRGEEVLLHFEVRDTGIGVAREEQARIFDAFVQADPSATRAFGGTGLGLSIARHLCEVMGGRIGVESEPGVGSLFWFTAAFRKPEADRPAPRAP